MPEAKRHLVAIMFTDIVGYSALASRDEEEALRLLNINRNHQKPIIEKYGIYIKEMGDGVLAKFSSASDSVRCAIEIQENTPKELIDKIRIGIHLGDVFENNGDIFGDGVNVASRLESKAKPGKIYISDSVYNAIKGRRDITSKYVGAFKLKNLKDPVRTFTIVNKEQARSNTYYFRLNIWKSLLYILATILSASAIIELADFLVTINNLDQGIVDIVILVLIFIISGFLFFIWLKHYRIKVIIAQVLNIFIALLTIGFYIVNPLVLDPSVLRLVDFDYNEKNRFESLNSLVVLPFSNYIGEDQEYLVAGIHDGLISEIGKLGSIRVISRTSTLPYAKAEKSIKTIAQELNVDMVVEASMIRIDTVIELNIKLINPFPDEKLLWSHSYQINISEIIKLYKEVTRNVALKINDVILPSEEKFLESSFMVNSEAYEAMLMGKYFLGHLTPDAFNKAERYFQKTIDLDSTYSPALSGLSMIWMGRKQMGHVSPKKADPIIKKYLTRAMQLDSTFAEVWLSAGALSVWTDYDFARGEEAFQRSIALNPNISNSRAGYAHLLMILNRWDEAWEQMQYALEIDPLNPIVMAFSGIMYMKEGKFLSATKKFEAITAMVPDHPLANLYLLNKYARTFQHKKAIVELKKFIGVNNFRGLEKLIDESFAINGFDATIRLTAEALAERSKTIYIPASKIEMLYNLIGDTERRLYWMEEMYNQNDPGVPYLAIRIDDPIQEAPRYISIMEKIGLW